MFLSICIPSYNRPLELRRLLDSIDSKQYDEIEIVICEDKSPKRDEIREQVEQYKVSSNYNVNYIENEKNCGYDKNLRQCIMNATGEWIVFMGDDDTFIPGGVDNLLSFLHTHENIGYMLRSYQNLHVDGTVEKFRYYGEDKFWDAGEEAYLTLFRKSVFISGFTFKREYAVEGLTDQFDGTLLYQLYIMAEICMKHPSAYFSIPITQATDEGTPFFGTSEAEKDLYTPGSVTIDNSIRFMERFFIITGYMDEKYHIQSTEKVKMDISKYSYPILSIQRKRGRKDFQKYHKRLCEIGLNCSKYYYVYYVGLYLFGEKFCDGGIRMIKKIWGRTPKL